MNLNNFDEKVGGRYFEIIIAISSDEYEYIAATFTPLPIRVLGFEKIEIF